jgi:hypothetical protein
LSEDDEKKPPLDAALRHLAEQQRRSLTSHPTPQELAAYHGGELPPEAETRMLDHLAICRDCSDLLLDLAGFADLKPPQGVPELTDQQVEQDWQALRARMRAGEGGKEEERRTAEVVPIRRAGPAAKPARWSSPWLPVAASLLAVIGLSFGLYQSQRVGALERRVDELSQPSSPDSIFLDSTIQRSGGEQEEKAISSRAGTLLTFYSEADDYAAYEAVIDNRLTIKAAPREEDQGILLLIPPGSLQPGPHTVVLYGVDGDLRNEVARYPIRVDVP